MPNDHTAPSIEFQDALIGRVLQDRYRVIRMLGRGGMGVVYLAEHVLIQRKLAIKFLHSQWTASEELVQRFHREARAAAAAGDEHVVDVTDMGRLQDGTYYMVLEYLDGPDLATLVEREGPLQLARAVDVGLQVCEALGAVHAAGIVHRDLKPENVVLIQRKHRADFVKVLDFGICKVFNELPLTATGVALGTPQFMAPEQLEARPEVDQRADIYALGAILFFALTGRNLFESESLPRLLVSIWSDPPPLLRLLRPDAPPELERVISRALEKQPSRRYASVAELAAELGAIGAELGVASPSERRWASSSGVRTSEGAAVPQPQASAGSERQPREGTFSTQPSAANQSGVRLRARRRTLARWAGAVLSGAVLIGWVYLLAASFGAPVPPAKPAPRALVPVSRPEPARPPESAPAPAGAAEPSVAPAPAEPPRRRPRAKTPPPPAAGPPAEPPAAALPIESIPQPAEPTPPPAPQPSFVPAPPEIKPVF